MTRAQRLIDPDKPLHLHVVMAEAALRLAVGTPEIRREPLEHLIAMSEQSNVTIQLIRPEDGSPPPALASSSSSTSRTSGIER
ncbi:MAG: Scr1 family TA system antitoxin-like transcriptional regulator [Pseudonocardiaceae bacterium]